VDDALARDPGALTDLAFPSAIPGSCYGRPPTPPYLEGADVDRIVPTPPAHPRPIHPRTCVPAGSVMMRGREGRVLVLVDASGRVCARAPMP
jgi:hypothetical protein